MSYLLELGKVTGIVAGLVAALGVLAKSPVGRAVRWLYKQILGEPVGSWFRGHVGRVIDEKLLARNGGTTVPDAIERVDSLRREVIPRLESIENKLKGAA